MTSTTPSAPPLPQASATHPAFSSTWPKTSPLTGYAISEHLLGTPHVSRAKFKIIVAGAGASGIDFLHSAKEELVCLGFEVRCFEKLGDVGGTWLENRYPGCACDIPSVCYQFSWKAKSDWTKFYSPREEIWQYLKDIVVEEELDRFITFRTEIKGAVWDEKNSKWEISLQTTDDEGVVKKEWKEECDFFVNSTGPLNKWRYPKIPGLSTFAGILTHTANYDPSIDLTGKRVGVIGSGSSALQILPAIQPFVSHLYTWVRSPTYVTASFAQKFAGENGANFSYTEKQKKEWKENSEEYLRYRKEVENEMNVRFKFLLNDTQEAAIATTFTKQIMAAKLNQDQHLVNTIIPKTFNLGCRRPSPGPGYLEALTQKNVTVLSNEIASITPTGITNSDGTHVPLDILICATGFDTTFIPAFPIIGLQNTNLQDLWLTKPLAYLSHSIPSLPNYFHYLGPFAPLAHGSILSISSHLTQYLIQLLITMQQHHIRRLSPRLDATRAFGEHAELFSRRTAWMGDCKSWFKQGKGLDEVKSGEAVVAMWPGSRVHFFEALKAVRWGDWEVVYWGQENGKGMAWLGCGFASCEFSEEDGEERDGTWYLGSLKN